MQHRIGGRQDAFGLNQASGWAKERQQFGGASAHVLVWLYGRLAFQVPVCSRLGNGLIGSGFILTQLHNAGGFCLLVGLLDQVFFSPALGSWTVTVPALRTRRAVPVGHHVRVLPKR